MRFGRFLTLFPLVLLVSFSSVSQEQKSQEWRKWVNDIAKQSEVIKQKTLAEQGHEIAEWMMPDDKEMEEFKAQSKAVMEKTVSDWSKEQGLSYDPSDPDCVGSRCDVAAGDLLRVFVSFAMSERELIELFQEAATYEGDIKFHLRGVEVDTGTIDGTIKRGIGVWQKAKIEKRFSFTFAPDLFEEMNIDSVPTMVYERSDGMILTARGYTDFEFFQEKSIAAKQSGQIGVYGTQVDVEEKHLFDDLKERMEKLNIEEKLAQKGRDYFKNRHFESLPYAVKDRVYKYDPSLRVTEDIYLPNGVKIRSKGDVLNPMKGLPYSEAIIIADFTNPKQKAFVKETLLPRAFEKNVVTVITTKFRGEDGWQWLADLEDELGVPVYDLDIRLVNTFKFQAVPLLSTSAELHFDIWEFGKETWDKPEVNEASGNAETVIK